MLLEASANELDMQQIILLGPLLDDNVEQSFREKGLIVDNFNEKTTEYQGTKIRFFTDRYKNSPIFNDEIDQKGK